MLQRLHRRIRNGLQEPSFDAELRWVHLAQQPLVKALYKTLRAVRGGLLAELLLQAATVYFD